MCGAAGSGGAGGTVGAGPQSPGRSPGPSGAGAARAKRRPRIFLLRDWGDPRRRRMLGKKPPKQKAEGRAPLRTLRQQYSFSDDFSLVPSPAAGSRDTRSRFWGEAGHEDEK